MGIVTRSQEADSQRWFGLRGKRLVFWITVACATDMALFGYDQGLFSGVVLCQDYLDILDLNGPSKTNLRSIITSIYAIGCFCGAVVSFTVGQRLGRKKSILLGCLIMTLGTILQASAFSVPHMLVGRIVAGIGNGINTATAPVWQTETSAASNRGKLVVAEMALNIFGFMLVNWINYGLSFAGGAIAWRLPIALQMVFIVVLFLTVPWLPESPRWLISQDRADEAAVILADLAGAADLAAPHVVAERREIEYSVRYERGNAERWRDVLRGRAGAGTRSLRRLALGAGLQAIQQFAGINVISYYLPTLLEQSVGLSENLARLIAACAAVIYLAAAVAAAPMVERFGRRAMLLVSTVIQFLCFLLITVLLYYAEKPGFAGASKAAEASVVFFILYNVGFGLGMLGIPWLYATEINSLPMRTKGAAAATMTNWITNFIVVEITPIGIQNLGWKFYVIWTVTNAVILPTVWAFYPETANRNLEDLDAYYRSQPALVVAKDPDATCRRRPQKYVDISSKDIKEVEAQQAQVEHVA